MIKLGTISSRGTNIINLDNRQKRKIVKYLESKKIELANVVSCYVPPSKCILQLCLRSQIVQPLLPKRVNLRCWGLLLPSQVLRLSSNLPPIRSQVLRLSANLRRIQSQCILPRQALRSQCNPPREARQREWIPPRQAPLLRQYISPGQARRRAECFLPRQPRLLLQKLHILGSCFLFQGEQKEIFRPTSKKGKAFDNYRAYDHYKEKSGITRMEKETMEKLRNIPCKRLTKSVNSLKFCSSSSSGVNLR
jgi:hypothetical protein